MEHPLIVVRLLSGAALLVLSASVAGCAHLNSSYSGQPIVKGSSESTPGPWADLLKSTYEDATNEQQREALQDGLISDQEYSYFQGQIVACFKALGATAKWANDKSLEYTRPAEVTQEAIDKCNEDSGLNIIALRDAMDRNPRQLDENEILVTCLKRVDAVDPSYSASMLASGVGLDRLSKSPLFEKCNADPLNFGEREK